MRQTWNEYFMGLAEHIKERATCSRLKVGCILVKDNRIISTGYNGSIKGHEHCTDAECLVVEENGKKGCKRTIHAELNAVLDCARNGVATEGATAYVTHYPCPDCMKTLNQAGIKEVIYRTYYSHRYENNFHDGMEVTPYEDTI